MASPAEKVSQLRQLLSERFGSSSAAKESVCQTGVAALDEIGIPGGALTEVVTVGPAGTLLLYGLIEAMAGRKECVVLVDGKDAFQPKGLSDAEIGSLLWARCPNAREALQVADLAARDGNFPLILVLLTLNPPVELRRIPANTWHRLQMLAEKSATSLLVFTSVPQVGSARLRLSVGGTFSLPQLHDLRSGLLPDLQIQVERRRIEKERG